MLIATLVITLLGAGLGVLLGFAARFLAVEENPVAKQIENMLPGSQCGQCGFPGCSAAASAVASGEAGITFCPPGGRTLIDKIAGLLDIDPASVGDVPDPLVAAISEEKCTGCTRCFKACPTDAVVGANGQIHVVLDSACTGCTKCVDVCPEECISMETLPVTLESWHWDKPVAA